MTNKYYNIDGRLKIGTRVTHSECGHTTGNKIRIHKAVIIDYHNSANYTLLYEKREYGYNYDTNEPNAIDYNQKMYMPNSWVGIDKEFYRNEIINELLDE